MTFFTYRFTYEGAVWRVKEAKRYVKLCEERPIKRYVICSYCTGKIAFQHNVLSHNRLVPGSSPGWPTTSEWISLHSKSPIGFDRAFLIPLRHSSSTPENPALRAFPGAPCFFSPACPAGGFFVQRIGGKPASSFAFPTLFVYLNIIYTLRFYNRVFRIAPPRPGLL